MQKKTIAKAIKIKMEDWLRSITDESLRNDVRKNLLVTGGSIYSMMTNQKVNDYDVYIQDMDVLVRLAKYYCTPFSIEVWDGRKKEEYDRGNSEDSDAAYDVAVRTLKEDQVKLYVGWGRPITYGDDAELKPYRPMFFSPNAISLSDDVQIVTRFNGDAEQIHKTFDFIHATNYYTDAKGLVYNQAALESILEKRLRYQGSLYPLTSIIRVRKFLKREWNIGAGELLKIMFQISELDLTDIDTLEDQLIGVDVAYFGLLVEALRNCNPEKITSSYINSIIDSIFDSEDAELQ
jgi:hypothetical protein